MINIGIRYLTFSIVCMLTSCSTVKTTLHSFVSRVGRHDVMADVNKKCELYLYDEEYYIRVPSYYKTPDAAVGEINFLSKRQYLGHIEGKWVAEAGYSHIRLSKDDINAWFREDDKLPIEKADIGSKTTTHTSSICILTRLPEYLKMKLENTRIDTRKSGINYVLLPIAISLNVTETILAIPLTITTWIIVDTPRNIYILCN